MTRLRARAHAIALPAFYALMIAFAVFLITVGLWLAGWIDDGRAARGLAAAFYVFATDVVGCGLILGFGVVLDVMRRRR